jgi:rhamnosyltransferase
MLTVKIAVILATYNGECWLEEQIESIINQVEVSVDIYIFDDGSIDRTVEIIDFYSNQYPNIYVINRKRLCGKPGCSFFYALSILNIKLYDFISFSDQDDVWFRGKLIRGVSCMNSGDFDAYSSATIAFNSDSARYVKLLDCYKEFDYYFESAGPGCTYLLSKAIALDLKNVIRERKIDLHNIYFHDWLVYAFSRVKKYKWYYDKCPTLFYRQHNHNAIGAQGNIGSIKKRVKMIFNGEYLKLVMHVHSFIQKISIDSEYPHVRSPLLMNKMSFIVSFYKYRKSNFHSTVILIFILFFNKR